MPHAWLFDWTDSVDDSGFFPPIFSSLRIITALDNYFTVTFLLSRIFFRRKKRGKRKKKERFFQLKEVKALCQWFINRGDSINRLFIIKWSKKKKRKIYVLCEKGIHHCVTITRAPVISSFYVTSTLLTSSIAVFKRVRSVCDKWASRWIVLN